jgi:hypothetical protein
MSKKKKITEVQAGAGAEGVNIVRGHARRDQGTGFVELVLPESSWGIPGPELRVSGFRFQFQVSPDISCILYLVSCNLYIISI